eukprot:UN13144
MGMPRLCLLLLCQRRLHLLDGGRIRRERGDSAFGGWNLNLFSTSQKKLPLQKAQVESEERLKSKTCVQLIKT